ncbi:hypothetical protein A2cp1_2143 [Anaeromyxobacter dehalogenans 2CP-1]|uniref:Uncharacterized protein n=1 Tax=Anaeromyxobacter dehalogenans (strain ATCC BAA-258 / DSM 21875 / 2CP-1) TaxID=455488 RepID=B8J977_ANAD2|nr:hypothetical protein [Anaeromyxobacter dehalogenans]ACL65483.1 hypothetical protein A2cp1_2143 [Anaeromyxobacter dehalogenans 2CP-1]
MRKTVASRSDAREREYEDVGRARAAKRAAVVAEKRAAAERRKRAGELAAEATAAGLTLRTDHVEWLLTNPAEWLPSPRSREQAETLYHRCCLALLRGGLSVEQAELLARHFVSTPGGRPGRDRAYAAILRLASLFTTAELQRAEVRRVVYRLARFAVGSEAFAPHAAKNGARLVKDCLRNLPADRLETLNIEMYASFITPEIAREVGEPVPILAPWHELASDDTRWTAELELAIRLEEQATWWREVEAAGGEGET